MNRMTRLLAAAGAVAACGMGQAYAADAVVREPVIIADVFSWTGFYVGANVGYGWGEADHQAGTNSGTGINDFDIDGAFAGGQIGYNWQFNQIVLGAEADIQWSGIDGDCGQANAVSRSRPNTKSTGSARCADGSVMPPENGCLISPAAMLSVTQPARQARAAARSADANIDGWVAGAGRGMGFRAELVSQSRIPISRFRRRALCFQHPRVRPDRRPDDSYGADRRQLSLQLIGLNC